MTKVKQLKQLAFRISDLRERTLSVNKWLLKGVIQAKWFNVSIGSPALRCIFRKFERVVGTGWSWLRIGTGGGYLYGKEPSGSTKLRGIS
jgi:hypothetical protein